MDGSVRVGKSSWKMLELTSSSKLDWACYIISIAKTASKKIGALIRSVKFLSPEVALYLYKSTIYTPMYGGLLSCLGWCHWLLVGTVRQATEPNTQDCWSFTCYLSWTLGSLWKCGQLESSIGITLVDALQNWLNWFCFLFPEGGLLVILIDCMIFLSPFLDPTGMSMSRVSFLSQLDSGILCLYNAFLWHMIWVALSLELTDFF